jgi:hypothetical protein
MWRILYVRERASPSDVRVSLRLLEEASVAVSQIVVHIRRFQKFSRR